MRNGPNLVWVLPLTRQGFPPGEAMSAAPAPERSRRPIGGLRATGARGEPSAKNIANAIVGNFSLLPSLV